MISYEFQEGGEGRHSAGQRGSQPARERSKEERLTAARGPRHQALGCARAKSLRPTGRKTSTGAGAITTAGRVAGSGGRGRP